MKLILLNIVFLVFIQAQSGSNVFHYTYDGSGNRIKREYTTVQLKKSFEPKIKQYDMSSIKVFPNPTFGEVNINFEGIEDKSVIIEVFNMSGNTIIKKSGLNSNYLLDLTENPNGIYFVNITIDDKISFWKIIKEK